MGDESSGPRFGITEVTNMHPLVLGVVLLATVMMLFGRRRNAIIPFFVVAIFVPQAQTIVLGGINLHIVRILIILGWLRLIVRSEFRFMRGNSIDAIMLLWVLSKVIAVILLWQEWDAFVNIMGFAFNAIGIYFLLRCLLVDLEDFTRAIKIMVLIALPVAVFMLFEKATGYNLFAVFGGVPAITVAREGSLRSQGAFAHSITAGMFGATLMPLFVSLRWQEGG